MVSIKKNLCAKDQLPTQAAKSLASIIVASVKNRGHCYCALSGGSSPKPMLSALAQENLPWNDVSFLLVDERWSNEASQQNISMITEFVAQTGKQNIDVFSLLLETEFESNLGTARAIAATTTRFGCFGHGPGRAHRLFIPRRRGIPIRNDQLAAIRKRNAA